MKLNKIEIKNFIGQLTRPLRDGIILVIAPGLYKDYCQIRSLAIQGIAVPRPAILFIKNFEY